jgi:hypothetical protein
MDGSLSPEGPPPPTCSSDSIRYHLAASAPATAPAFFFFFEVFQLQGRDQITREHSIKRSRLEDGVTCSTPTPQPAIRTGLPQGYVDITVRCYHGDMQGPAVCQESSYSGTPIRRQSAPLAIPCYSARRSLWLSDRLVTRTAKHACPTLHAGQLYAATPPTKPRTLHHTRHSLPATRNPAPTTPLTPL